MQLILFADNTGCSRSIRGDCIQPVMGGASAREMEHTNSNAIYTAVMEVYEL